MLDKVTVLHHFLTIEVTSIYASLYVKIFNGMLQYEVGYVRC